MEEILASIRKIIADDQILPLSRRAEEPAAPAAESTTDDLRAEMQAAARAPARRERFGYRDEPAPPPVAAPVQQRPPRAAIPRPSALDAYEDLARAAEAAPQASAPAPEPAPQPEAPRLLSPATDAQLATSFGALNTTMMLQESGVIEDGVKELLRPMLKQWLDDNLPGIVERLVRQEIERVARGRR
jgi:cell pole-organizing protein PopZ